MHYTNCLVVHILHLGNLVHISKWQQMATYKCLCMTLQPNYELTQFKPFSKHDRSLQTRLEKCCMNTVNTTKPRSMNKVYRTNQVYLITPRCKSSLSIQTVRKHFQSSTLQCLAQTTNVAISLSSHSSILCHWMVQTVSWTTCMEVICC
jgi:hypothetical protein